MRRVQYPGARSPFVITVEQPAETATYRHRATGRHSGRAVGDAPLGVVNTTRFEDPAGL